MIRFVFSVWCVLSFCRSDVWISIQKPSFLTSYFFLFGFSVVNGIFNGLLNRITTIIKSPVMKKKVTMRFDHQFICELLWDSYALIWWIWIYGFWSSIQKSRIKFEFWKVNVEKSSVILIRNIKQIIKILHFWPIIPMGLTVISIWKEHKYLKYRFSIPFTDTFRFSIWSSCLRKSVYNLNEGRALFQYTYK